ncbi:hypothetical protein ACS0TY_032432 [Phlomoides rotata]
MVVLSQPILDNLAYIKTCRPTSTVFTGVPEIDLSDANAKSLIVNACTEFGFFKVTNHGVPMEFLARLEAEALEFFKLTPQEKEMSGPPSPFGYGSKNIGPNGDVGWVEYLLFCANYDTPIPGISDTLRGMVTEYVGAVKDMACAVVEMVAEEMGMGERDILSRMLLDEKSDSCFRLNHYPPCPQLQALSGRSLIGFGEHTDPQIVSVLRSNNASGLQICLRDGSWVSVPSDHTTFFFIVGDSLQVMTNGKFRSVKHRVLANGFSERVSMIYFGGPPVSEKIRTLLTMGEGEESLYKEFTWGEYKKSAYKTRLADNRLEHFEKSAYVAN